MLFNEYIKQVEADGREWIVENLDHIDPDHDDMVDELWAVDEVTGNGSGSYTFNTWKAWENIAGSNYGECLLFDEDFTQELEDMDLNVAKLLEEGPEAIDVTARVMALYHVEWEDILEELFDGWQGEGWYSIEFNDGQHWTNDGPVWLDYPSQLHEELQAARATETENHLASCEYLGDDEDPEEA